MEKKYKQANAALALTVVGLACCAPYGHTFWGALGQSAFGAAVVGGLADWFAVTALFGKPLGIISWRANIVAKNKDRFLTELTTLVEEELLTAENVAAVLRRYSLTEALQDYLRQSGGRKFLEAGILRLLAGVVQAQRPDEAAALTKWGRQKMLRHFDAAPLLGDLLRQMLRQKEEQQLVAAVLEQIQDLLKQPAFAALLQDIARDVLERYETNGGALRSLVTQYAKLDSPERIQKIVTLLDEALERMKAPEHPLRHQGRAWLWKKARRLQRDPGTQRRVEVHKRLLLRKYGAALDEGVRSWLHGYQKNTTEAASTLAVWAQWLTRRLAGNLDEDSAKRQDVEEWLLQQIKRLLKRHKHWSGEFVASYIGAMSGEELALFIKERVADDLQMIRINGSVVGGAAGALLFLLTQVLEKAVAL